MENCTHKNAVRNKRMMCIQLVRAIIFLWRCDGVSIFFLPFVSVPDDFNWDPATKSFGEPTRRPEIRNATVEFIAPSEYMVTTHLCPFHFNNWVRKYNVERWFNSFFKNCTSFLIYKLPFPAFFSQNLRCASACHHLQVFTSPLLIHAPSLPSTPSHPRFSSLSESRAWCKLRVPCLVWWDPFPPVTTAPLHPKIVQKKFLSLSRNHSLEHRQLKRTPPFHANSLVDCYPLKVRKRSLPLTLCCSP